MTSGDTIIGEINVNENSYFKLSIPIIMKNYKKVLFLDADIIVEKDIAELYNTDGCGAQGYRHTADEDRRREGAYDGGESSSAGGRG